MAENNSYNEYIGILHIHSKYSDGSGKVKHIIKQAQKALLDFIIITDHNNLFAMKNGYEGWHNNLLVLVGEEIGNRGDEHYLAFGINETIKPEVYRYKTEKYISAVKGQGGIGFAAHPNHLQKNYFNLEVSPWFSFENPDYTGIEIWSYMYDWAENLTPLNILYYFLHPEKAIDGPPADLLKKWDQLCQTRRIVGIGSADAHARYLLPFKFVKFLSYKRVFNGIRTHILTKSQLSFNLFKDKWIIYDALKAGNCFFAHDFLINSKGFVFEAKTKEGRIAIMGDEVKLKSPIELRIYSPVLTDLALIKDGKVIKETRNTNELIYNADSCGVYRAYARYKNRPWAFTNHIYVKEEK
ncbi:MAG: PHP domain-containing protein [bacterium]